MSKSKSLQPKGGPRPPRAAPSPKTVVAPPSAGWTAENITKLMDSMSESNRIRNDARVKEMKQILQDKTANVEWGEAGLILWHSGAKPLPRINLAHPMAKRLLASRPMLLKLWEETSNRSTFDDYIVGMLEDT